MEPQQNYPSAIRIISLLLALSCGAATAARAADTNRSRPTAPRRPAPPAQPASSASGGAAAIAPRALSGASVDAVRAAETKTENRNAEPRTDAPGPLARELWSGRIAAPEAGDDAQTSLALKRLIRQVRVLTLNTDKTPVSPSAPPIEAPAQAQTPTPVTANVEGVAPAPAEPVAAAAAPTPPALAPKMQKTLEGLQRNAGRVRDPLEVAELLFLSGRPPEAVPFYEEALRRAGTGGPASGADRAWILFQLGNCLRETDATKAQDAYMKLIAEYPDSPWTEMARASGRLLAWYQSTRPDRLIAPPKP